jgi:hypothetical protein
MPILKVFSILIGTFVADGAILAPVETSAQWKTEVHKGLHQFSTTAMGPAGTSLG